MTTREILLLTQFETALSSYARNERSGILSAARWAAGLHTGQQRASGEPYIIHPIRVAEILIENRLDYEVVTAALLHDILEDTQVTRSQLQQEFGENVESLVYGVTKISVLRGSSKTVQKAETIRKMLFAMVKDIRVILIKLADKLHNMRTLDHLAEASRKRIAGECLDIYAPLAERLGMSRIKNELEDLSLQYLRPSVYRQIEQYVADREHERESYLEQVKASLQKEAQKAGIKAQIESRTKHFCSIYKKMKNRSKSIEEIYDLLGIRVICDTDGQCYELLGLVHRLWLPIERRFKDYIAMPKSNRYQSLHTTVMGQGGRKIEIQIRTKRMHRTAEDGIAAHWIYKRRRVGEVHDRGELPLIHKLKDWAGADTHISEFLDEIKRELLKDSIYVFTPKGDVIELPKGSTPIDFAYHIHSEVGNHCIGARADGRILPLKHALRNTQIVEIITANSAHPHLAWLRHVKTARARSRIRHWLNQNDANLFIDRNIVAKKKGRLIDSLVAPQKRQVETQILDKSKIGIRIGDERNMMIRLGLCCNPMAGDPIIGYVSRGRGIIVHRSDCTNLEHIKEFAERKIDVEWETVSPKATRRFVVSARPRFDLFSELEGALRKHGGHLIEGKLDDSHHDTLKGAFTVELENAQDFNKVLKDLRMIPSIRNIRPQGKSG